MEIIEMILSNLIIFQIFTEIVEVTLGAGLCFGALKWRKGLLTTTAIGWGLVLGVLTGMVASEILGGIGGIICILLGVIVLPILTYKVPAVNRFVLGFLVSCKLLCMLTTVLAKAGTIDIGSAILLPILGGTIVGFVLMAWTRMRVSAFVLGCNFVGASMVAPVISSWINRIFISVTGDIGFLFDPVDLLFAIFKIELTDLWVLISMIVLMALGGYKQIGNLKKNGIPLDTPLISFESTVTDNGKIYTESGSIDTMK